MRAWFDEQLITEAGTRGLVQQGERESGGLPNGVVRTLQRRFLVRGEARGGDTWIELVHDRFVEPIRRSNREWFVHNLSPLTLAAQEWHAAGKPASKLYPLALLLAVEGMRAQNDFTTTVALAEPVTPQTTAPITRTAVVSETVAGSAQANVHEILAQCARCKTARPCRARRVLSWTSPSARMAAGWPLPPGTTPPACGPGALRI